MKEVKIGGHLYNCITEIGWVFQQRFRDEVLAFYRSKFPPKKKKKGERFTDDNMEGFEKWVEKNIETMQFKLLCLDVIYEPMNGAPKISLVLQKNIATDAEDAEIWRAINNFFTNVRGKEKTLTSSAKGSQRTKGLPKKA